MPINRFNAVLIRITLILTTAVLLFSCPIETADLSNADLSGLSVEGLSLSPEFSAEVTDYSAEAGNDISSLKVKASTLYPGSSLLINGISAASGINSESISLAEGSNTITVKVTSADGTVSKIYTLSITREATSVMVPDTSLCSLSISDGILTPSFSADLKSYSASVGNSTASITVTPESADSSCVITVNGSAVDSGSISGMVSLAEGSNLITVRVTDSTDSYFTDYKITVTRDAATAGASAEITGGNMSLQTGSSSYVSASVSGFNYASINYLWVLRDPDSNDTTLSNDTDSGVQLVSYSTPISSRVGDYTLFLTVTDGDGASASDQITVTVYTPNNSPTASFSVSSSASRTPYVVGETVSFDASASEDSDGIIDSYSWDFADGSTADGTSDTASHVYSEAGIYIVELTVTDDDDAVDSVQAEAFTVITAPQAVLSSPGTVYTGVPVILDGSASTGSDSSVPTVFWNVNPQDGGTYRDASTSTSATDAYVFWDIGDYNVDIEVYGGARTDVTDTDSMTFSVASGLNLHSTSSTDERRVIYGTAFDSSGAMYRLLNCDSNPSGSTDYAGLVEKYNGSSWTVLDDYFGTGADIEPVLSIDSADRPWVARRGTSDGVVLYYYTGSAWSRFDRDLGNETSSSYTNVRSFDIVSDSRGNTVIAYTDHADNGYIHAQYTSSLSSLAELGGSSAQPVGGALSSSGSLDLEIDSADKLYAAFVNSNSVYMYSFDMTGNLDAGTWSPIDCSGIPLGTSSVDLLIDGTTLYTAVDGPEVYQYTGSGWNLIGDTDDGLSNGVKSFITAGNGKLVLVYGDDNYSKASVYRNDSWTALYGGQNIQYKNGTSIPSVFADYNNGSLYFVRGVDIIDLQEIVYTDSF